MNEINIRFASKAEAQELIPGNTQYYNRLKQMDIDWRARKENATLDELIAFAQSQVQDFTPRNINILKDSICHGMKPVMRMAKKRVSSII